MYKEINPEKSEADNKKHREQVELINDLKRKETKHVETVNRLEKVIFLIQSIYQLNHTLVGIRRGQTKTYRC